MAKRKKLFGRLRPLTRRQKALVLPAMVVVGAGAVIVAVLVIIAIPPAATTYQPGVAANGFYAYKEQDSDLGIGTVVTQANVVKSLGAKAKSVGDVTVSGVFNYDGQRSQTATYKFIRADSTVASLYVDVTFFPDSTTMTDEGIYANTAKAPAVHNYPTYYMQAQTLGPVREYRLLVVNGLKAYKFVIDQPYSSVTISEPTAFASLIKLARTANL